MLKINVLIIEDSSSQRRLLNTYLKEFDCNIVFAEDGDKGLRLAMSKRLDLIISDIEMPGVSGLEICKLVRENRPTAVPVILISSLSRDADIEKGFQAGASAYLSKPYKKKELLEIISDVLKKKSLRQKQHILLVDDSRAIRSLVSGGLIDSGFRVSMAANGTDALNIALDNKPDLILSDLNMPVMNGVQFCQIVKAEEKLKDIPFIVMSSNGDRGTMRWLMQLGANGYLVKPFSAVQITMLIEKFLDDHMTMIMKDQARAITERKMMLAGIMGLAKALEARDTYTGSHSETVSQVAARIAEAMSLKDEEIDAISLAGRLHDIGKIGIPDRILLKPGKLTEEEFSEIHKHPQIGYDILKHIPSLEKSMPAVLHHHEKFVGKGYPNGLNGEKIPLSARIVAVADVWHAVYSDRPYRPALSREKSLNVIRGESGKSLCPKCVDAFFSIEHTLD